MVWTFETDDGSRSGYFRAADTATAFRLLGTSAATLWQVPIDCWRSNEKQGVVEDSDAVSAQFAPLDALDHNLFPQKLKFF